MATRTTTNEETTMSTTRATKAYNVAGRRITRREAEAAGLLPEQRADRARRRLAHLVSVGMGTTMEAMDLRCAIHGQPSYHRGGAR